MKQKNPLYVVKGKDVEEASSLFDLVIKKFNLGPLMVILENLLNLLLKKVNNYATFTVVKDFFDHLFKGLFKFLRV